VQVKNRAPAPIQITAEQILIDAKSRQERAPPAPEVRISDQAELAEFRMRKRKEFEDMLRNHKHAMGLWLRYAAWEESQFEMKRARNVYERALDVDYQDSRLWLKYAAMEMKAQFIHRARNVLNRAVTLLPRVDAFWYRYVYMEQMVGNNDAARAVFERWMEWEPEAQSWKSFINFEVRCGNLDSGRLIWERLVLCHPQVDCFIQYAKWEQKQRQPVLSRRVFDRALEELTVDEQDEQLYIEYAVFEESLREFERARAILAAGVQRLPPRRQVKLSFKQSEFEKKHGATNQVEDLVFSKRREQYEADVASDPLNYDTWFDYMRLEQSAFESSRSAETLDRARGIHRRAQSAIPPVQQKLYWKRYIYTWLFAAVFEERIAQDKAAARATYREALACVPHHIFTFSKLWLMAAQFEVRCLDMVAARQILGRSLGQCPRRKVLNEYVELELRLGNVQRCRTLLAKQVELFPCSAVAWCKFVEFEVSMGELARARQLLELGTRQEDMDAPEAVWKASIDLEIDVGEWPRARSHFERLLDRSKALSVWCSFAGFEAEHAGDAEAARAIYERGYRWLKDTKSKEECAGLLQSWLTFEESLGSTNESNMNKVRAMLPTKCVKRRAVTQSDGTSAGMEEYFEYVFPDDDESKGLAKLAALAKQMAAGEVMLDDELDDSDDEFDETSAGEKRGTSPEPDAELRVSGRKRPAEHQLERGTDDNEIDIDAL